VRARGVRSCEAHSALLNIHTQVGQEHDTLVGHERCRDPLSRQCFQKRPSRNLFGFVPGHPAVPRTPGAQWCWFLKGFFLSIDR